MPSHLRSTNNVAEQADLARGPGSSSGQSSSGGSGNSSPQREQQEDLYALAPPAPLPNQPRQDELDMWEVLMSLDGARTRRGRRHTFQLITFRQIWRAGATSLPNATLSELWRASVRAA